MLENRGSLLNSPRDLPGLEPEEMAVQEMYNKNQGREGDEDGVKDYGPDVEFLGVLVGGEEGEGEVQAGEGQSEEDCVEDWCDGLCRSCFVGAWAGGFLLLDLAVGRDGDKLGLE